MLLRLRDVILVMRRPGLIDEKENVGSRESRGLRVSGRLSGLKRERRFRGARTCKLSGVNSLLVVSYSEKLEAGGRL